MMLKLKKYMPIFLIGNLILGSVHVRAEDTEQRTANLPAHQAISNGGASDNSFSPIDLSDTIWKDLKVPLGTKLVIKKDSNGKDKRVLEFLGGVSMYEGANGGSIGNDNSGHGAVMCAWTIYVEMSNIMTVCPAADDRQFKENLDAAIDRINDFIVKNSLSPVTKTDLENQIKKMFSDRQDGRLKMSKDELHKECLSSDLIKMVSAMKTISLTAPEKFNKSVDDLLSVPRPPVMNPCL